MKGWRHKRSTQPSSKSAYFPKYNKFTSQKVFRIVPINTDNWGSKNIYLLFIRVLFLPHSPTLYKKYQMSQIVKEGKERCH